MLKIGEININWFKEVFDGLQTDEVIVTEDRIIHIKEQHPEDYELFMEYKTVCIENPDIIITDERNTGTVYIIKKFGCLNLNMVLRLALLSDKENLKNSVMTFWRIRDKNLAKLAKKNKIVYKKD